MSFFIQSSNRNSTALPFKGSGPPRLYALASVGLTIYSRERLTRIAALAYCQRNVKAMEQAARELLTFDSDAALYYLAMAAKWWRRTDEARTLFESVGGNYQARAIQALGAIHFEAGRFDEAARMHIEAIQAGRQDAFAVIGARFQLSAIRSEYGEHEQSLDDLLSLWPVVKAAAKYQPHLWPLLHNEIGYELLQLGRTEQARKAIAVAVASPLVCVYPEWQATAREIAESERQAILIVVPARKQKVILRFQVVGLYVRRRVIKPTIGRAPIIRSITERVTAVAPIHPPPFSL